MVGRPYIVPKAIPADRHAALRKAFDDMIKDPEFVAEIDKQRLTIAPMNGAGDRGLHQRALQDAGRRRDGDPDHLRGLGVRFLRLQATCYSSNLKRDPGGTSLSHECRDIGRTPCAYARSGWHSCRRLSPAAGARHRLMRKPPRISIAAKPFKSWCRPGLAALSRSMDGCLRNISDGTSPEIRRSSRRRCREPAESHVGRICIERRAEGWHRNR